jgi:hypothetical protein
MRRSVRRHIAKIPHNIFKKPELELEEEEAPPPWVVRVGATSKGEEWRRKGGLGTVGRKRLMCHILIEPLMCHILIETLIHLLKHLLIFIFYKL